MCLINVRLLDRGSPSQLLSIRLAWSGQSKLNLTPRGPPDSSHAGQHLGDRGRADPRRGRRRQCWQTRDLGIQIDFASSSTVPRKCWTLELVKEKRVVQSSIHGHATCASGHVVPNPRFALKEVSCIEDAFANAAGPMFCHFIQRMCPCNNHLPPN